MPKRGKGGRFMKKSHHRKSSHRAATTKAIVVRQPQAIVVRTGGGAVAKRKTHHKRHSGGGGLAHRTPVKVKAELAGWASLAGYLETQRADTYNKIPVLGALPREATLGIVLHFVSKKNKHIDRASAALLTVAGYKIGAAGFKLSGDGDDY